MKNGESAQKDDNEYSDLIIIDILKPDFKNFWSRYKTDMFGFIVIIVIMLLMILAVQFLSQLGAK